jgi:hypothetical protein
VTLYVHVVETAEGTHAPGHVFTSPQRADQFLVRHALQGRKVWKYEVPDYAPGEPIYEANMYMPGDLHDFVGLYSTYDAAKHAAGESGVVLTREPNPQ